MYLHSKHVQKWVKYKFVRMMNFFQIDTSKFFAYLDELDNSSFIREINRIDVLYSRICTWNIFRKGLWTVGVSYVWIEKKSWWLRVSFDFDQSEIVYSFWYLPGLCISFHRKNFLSIKISEEENFFHLHKNKKFHRWLFVHKSIRFLQPSINFHPTCFPACVCVFFYIHSFPAFRFD